MRALGLGETLLSNVRPWAPYPGGRGGEGTGEACGNGQWLSGGVPERTPYHAHLIRGGPWRPTRSCASWGRARGLGFLQAWIVLGQLFPAPGRWGRGPDTPPSSSLNTVVSPRPWPLP